MKAKNYIAASRALSALTALALTAAGALSVSMFALPAAAETGGPTVVLTSANATTTNAASIPVSATFSEPVSGFASSSIDATNATVTDFSGSGADYTFDLAPSAQGAVSVMVPANAASSTASSTGSQASNTLTFTYDSIAPAISSIVVTPTTLGATISWTTSQAAKGQVAYGTSASYTASSSMETSATTSHSASLTGLHAATTYHYQISATDNAGNTATTSDATFTTEALAVAPTISDITVTGIGTSTATIGWHTDVAATGQIAYGTTASYGSTTTLDTSASTTHSVVLASLAEGTVYHFAITSADASGTTTSADQVFVTESTASSTPLAVSSTDTVSGTATPDDTFLHGWHWVMHLIVPDVENAFRMKFSDFVTTSSSSTIPAATNIRIYSPESSNASSESSAVYASDNNYGGWLYLTGDTSTTTPGRQIDLDVEVRVPSGTAAGTYTTTYGAQSIPSTSTSTTP
jgi:hypothetical protein